jgi:hypothetical protein
VPATKIPLVSRRASAGAGEIKAALGNIATNAAKEVIKPPVSRKMKLE